MFDKAEGMRGITRTYFNAGAAIKYRNKYFAYSYLANRIR